MTYAPLFSVLSIQQPYNDRKNPTNLVYIIHSLAEMSLHRVSFRPMAGKHKPNTVLYQRNPRYKRLPRAIQEAT